MSKELDVKELDKIIKDMKEIKDYNFWKDFGKNRIYIKLKNYTFNENKNNYLELNNENIIVDCNGNEIIKTIFENVKDCKLVDRTKEKNKKEFFNNIENQNISGLKYYIEKYIKPGEVISFKIDKLGIIKIECLENQKILFKSENKKIDNICDDILYLIYIFKEVLNIEKTREVYNTSIEVLKIEKNEVITKIEEEKIYFKNLKNGEVISSEEFKKNNEYRHGKTHIHCIQ